MDLDPLERRGNSKHSLSRLGCLKKQGPKKSKGCVAENSDDIIPTPNGFADHYPVFKWLFHWGYIPFSDISKWCIT